MTDGDDALRDVHAKLDWAAALHARMESVFEEFARPGGGDDRPYGIKFRQLHRPAGLVVARFIVEQPMPIEMSLLGADVVHNTRVALDHVLAQLKGHFGGDPGKGSFPTWRTEDDWQEKGARGGALHGLSDDAIELIYREQPLHRDAPHEDPLVILKSLDNDDKHRLLHQAFVCTSAEHGTDLIEVLDRAKVQRCDNLWKAGEPLDDGATLARFLIRGKTEDVLRARTDVAIGFGHGDVDAPRTTYVAMLERVRGIAEKAAALIDRG